MRGQRGAGFAGGRCARRTARRVARWIALLATALPATGTEVLLPIRLDEAFLERALAEQVFDDEGGASVLARRDGCGRARLSPRGLAAGQDGLRVRTQVDSRFGVSIAGLCWLTTDWEGELEILQVPELDPERPVVHFRVRDSRWTATREPFWLPSERAYHLVRDLVHPRLERFSVDLTRPIDELRSLLLLFWDADRRDVALRMAESLALSAVEAREGALVLVLRFEVPDAPAPPALPEPALTPEEVAAFEAAWQRWDAFVGFVVKQAGAGALRPEQRSALAEVLLEARYDLVAVLEAPPGRDDPVPGLFVATWERLAPVLRELQTGLPGEAALRTLAFVAAGDAVTALHELSPLGVELSADGLRRLARLVGPATDRDPLLYSVEVDPELRERLGFGPPIPLPDWPRRDAPVAPPRRPPAEPDALEPPPPPPGALEPAPAPPAPGALEPPPPAPDATAPAPAASWRQLGRRVGRGLAGLLVSPASAEPLPAVAAAAPAPDPPPLQGWAPTRRDVEAYLPLAGQLLRRTAAEVAAEEGLPDAWQPLFVPLVLATGWQESCWRQWVRKGGAVVPLRSGAGAVGILQVNVHVWRGLYDREALNGDIAYNARAGSEILRHYLLDYALRRLDAAEAGDPELVARVAYALYHGGPRHLRRPIEGAGSPALRAIDTAFLDKFQTVRDGRPEEAVAACY